MSFKGTLTDDQFNALHKEASKTRGKTVTVSKDALANLLSDYSELLTLLRIEEA